MTEFGAAEDILGDIFALQKTCELADRFTQSWLYWQFKYFQDITTCTPEGEALYFNNGTVCTDKLRVLTRTYPKAVAGHTISYEFSMITAEFMLSYYPLSISLDKGSTAHTTQIYFNRELNYPHGVQVDLSFQSALNFDASAFSVHCSDDGIHVLIIQNSLVSDSTVVLNLRLTRCAVGSSAHCTCP